MADRVVLKQYILLSAGATAVAALIRFWSLSDLGLTHFDEGSYVMAGKWLATLGKQGWIYQAGHSPGLFPTLVGIFFWLFGISDSSAIAASALSGSLTVGFFCFLGSYWLGPRVGVVSALLLATCEYHVIYSRLALTDTTFTLLFWAALASLYHATRVQSRSWFLLGGTLTGLCWNTKYHGFFPLLAIAVWLIIIWGTRFFRSRSQPDRAQAFRWADLLLASAAALLLYLPWLLFVEFTVGYRSILEGQLSHSLGLGSLIITTPQTLWFYLSSWVSPPILLLALIGLLLALSARERTLLFTATVCGLLATAILFYLSFPRLILPVIPGICLLSGYALVSMCGRVSRTPAIGLLSFGTAVVLIWNLLQILPVVNLKTDVYRRAAIYLKELREPLITQLKKNYYFYEESPSLEIRWQDLDELDALIGRSASVVVAVDPIIHKLTEEHAWVERHRPELSLLRSFEVRMYEPLYYQGFDPNLGFEDLPRKIAPPVPGDTRIEVYRLSH